MNGGGDDLRKMKRRHMIYYPEVIDMDSGRQLGRLADITTEGIMLSSERAFEREKDFKLELVLPHVVEGHDRILFSAKSRWSRRDVNPDHYATGFEIEKISYKDKLLIVGLINDYGFND